MCESERIVHLPTDTSRSGSGCVRCTREQPSYARPTEYSKSKSIHFRLVVLAIDIVGCGLSDIKLTHVIPSM